MLTEGKGEPFSSEDIQHLRGFQRVFAGSTRSMANDYRIPPSQRHREAPRRWLQRGTATRLSAIWTGTTVVLQRRRRVVPALAPFAAAVDLEPNHLPSSFAPCSAEFDSGPWSWLVNSFTVARTMRSLGRSQ